AGVLKPDPLTPLSVLRMAELAAEVGFPAGAINIVPADGPTTGAYLVKHPGVDKVAFTGSTRTGSEIMRLCSEPIKRLTLELGGKSPAVVFADANLADAVPSSVWSVYYAAGQRCEAGDGAGAFYLPTVLAGVESSMTVAQEEIFGPVVTAIPFEDEKDAIRIANDVRYGLFATVWTGDPARGHRVARAIKSGMVGINMPFTAVPGIPFGGYKQSGLGR